jgi:hypothetical protein
MSDLDDAIREHLELKRLRGGDPGEVARLEHEAFGDSSREAAAAIAAEHEPQLHAVPEPAHFDDPRDHWDAPASSVTHLPHRAGSYADLPLDAGEEPQEFRIEDELGWADPIASRRLA